MIAILDYGLGNINAFGNVYNKLNIPFFFASNSDDLQKATRIILPGVGSFDHAMTMLNNSGMRETLETLVLQNGIPVLGICVGMQILADSSDEGSLEGLGLIPGEVKIFSNSEGSKPVQHPLPHMGWNSIEVQREDDLFAGFDSQPRFYFLHSYYFQCKDKTSSLATADYGQRFSCIVKRDNIYGVQCHPEKSHHNGVLLLKNFAAV